MQHSQSPPYVCESCESFPVTFTFLCWEFRWISQYIVGVLFLLPLGIVFKQVRKCSLIGSKLDGTAQFEMSSISNSSFHGENSSFRDLLIFEQRLRQNMINLNRLQRKWELIFLVLISLILGVFYFYVKSENVVALSTAVTCITAILLFIVYKKRSLNKEYDLVLIQLRCSMQSGPQSF